VKAVDFEFFLTTCVSVVKHDVLPLQDHCLNRKYG